MTHQVFIASYAKDFPWLRCNLKSLRKFASGYLPPLVAVPECDHAAARALMDECYPEGIVVTRFDEPGNGFMSAQLAMLEVDKFTPATYIHLLGSDCVATRPFDPSAFFVGNLPLLYYESYDTVLKKCPNMPWKSGTERAVGKPTNFEFMRVLPLVYPRWLYPLTRCRVSTLHDCNFKDYVLRQRNDSGSHGGTDFSESNVLGLVAYIWLHEDFIWRDLATYQHPKLSYPILQMWGHGGFDLPIDDPHFSHKLDGVQVDTPREVLTHLGLL